MTPAPSRILPTQDPVGAGVIYERLSATATGVLAFISVLVLLGIGTELISSAVLPYVQGFVLARPNGARAHNRYYRNQPWAKTYWKELDASSQYEFKPYIAWRRKPFNGKYLNIDADGLRRTVNPSCSPGARRIWMFGGSTLWGTGARDDQTIPSILARHYSALIGPVCITNFGEYAWVSTQEIIQLELALKNEPNPPDLVIFYDGIGDVVSRYQSGGEDAPGEFAQVRRIVEERREQSAFGYLRQTNTYRFVGFLMNELLKLSAANDPSQTAKPKDLESLARLVVNNYQGNMGLLSSLSVAYGFRYAAVWGPVIFVGNKPLDSEEQQERKTAERAFPGMSELCTKVYAFMFQAQPDRHITSVANVFDHTSEDVFIDQVHTNPTGNNLIAQRLLETLRELSLEPKPVHRQT